jgi:hypothetical protein
LDQIQKISEAGAIALLEVLGLWIFLPIIVFFMIAWVIKLRGQLFNFVFFIFMFAVIYVFITQGLQTIPTVYYDKVGTL